MNVLNDKLEKLRRRFRDLGSAVVAFSGGVDSAVLAKVAHEELESRMVAVTAISPSYPARDHAEATVFCAIHGIPHDQVESHEFANADFRANPVDRCYHCKKALYTRLIEVAASKGYAVVVEGTNVTDLSGHRPGYRASSEEDRVVTPLIECGITKDEVRAIARELGLGPVAEKPATACLSSRVPTGTPLDPKDLNKVDRAEEAIRAFGIAQIRVRHHGNLARIEVIGNDVTNIIAHRTEIDARLREVGYRYVTIDLKAYRPATPEG